MKTHLLLIDDDDDEREIFIAALVETGMAFKFSFITDTDYALRRLKYMSPDFIFMDFNMPGMNGIECLTKIKTCFPNFTTPVIVYSTSIYTIMEKALEAGATACLKKTNTIPQLAKILKNIMLPIKQTNQFVYN
jgi:CheY-like chemotaxis protein